MLLGWLTSVAGPNAVGAPGPLSYNRDVRPILANHCLQCHGQDEKSRKGGLRLDDLEAARRGGKSGKAALVPGRSAEGELFRRLTTHEADDLMPPADAKNPVTSAEVDILRRWVDQGAEYQAHWAFLAPVRPPLPPGVERSDGVTTPARVHPVDALVRARLRQEGLAPSPEAAPETLIRRLFLDLIGLPPAPAEVDDFVRACAKDGERAYGAWVDRLLASPHFGEKWARHWLDAARYADSDGYEKDLPRQQWAWRDWVIEALNRDLPYDQFIVEQLAGDLLPNATQDQRVATGFLRNGMVNEEGAIIAEQFRLEGLIDRMDCLGKAVLGLTIQCGQCHSHKYDPFTQEEYYRLFSYLNNDYEAQSWVYSPAQLQTLERLHRGIAEQEALLQARFPDWAERLAKWEEDQRTATNAPTWSVLHPTEQEWIGGLSHPETLPDGSVLTLGFRPTHGELYVVAASREKALTGLRLEALTHGDLPFGGPGRSVRGTFAVSELEVEIRPLGSTNAWTKVALTNATADFAEAEHELAPPYRKNAEDHRRIGSAAFLVDGQEDTAWGADRGPGRRHQDSQVVMQFGGTNAVGYVEGTEFKIWLKFRHGGTDGHGRQNTFLGRFRLALTSAANPRTGPVSALARQALAIPARDRSPGQRAALFEAWRAATPEFREYNDRIETLWREHPEGDSVLNVAARDPEFARTTRMLERGNWQKPGRAVAAGTPAFLHATPADGPANRLTLARWLVDRRSPTTARVVVNRVWQSLFGLGLVETPEDFGIRAALPTHPDLLDWLAVELMEPSATLGTARTDGAAAPPASWSFKHLLRVLVSSATYRQSSAATAELLERDPMNRLLARGPRFRAEAEVIRDIALSASGLLQDRVGGPSFFPPVPEGLFALSFTAVDFWRTAGIPERYRRSLYVFRRRSMPDPVLASFDAPNGDFACVRRVRSNTPLAALTSLNEPVFVEAAQALALRVLREGGASDEQRATHAFRLCTSRAPRTSELNEVLNLLSFAQRRAADGWLPARDLAFADAKILPPLPADVTPSQAAAWTVVSRVLLNLDETVSKN